MTAEQFTSKYSDEDLNNARQFLEDLKEMTETEEPYATNSIQQMEEVLLCYPSSMNSLLT